MKANTIVTISRQYGSGGKEIAEILAQKMQVRCYDRQIVYLASEKIGNTDIEFRGILEESYQVPKIRGISLDGFRPGSDFIPDYNKMYKEQAAVIKRIAAQSGGVFLGRCADAILGDRENCYHFFVYADDEFRHKRALEYYENLSLKDLEKEDKTRERYYNYYTGQTWGDPKNYHLMINTSKIELEAAADLIISYIEKVQKN